jgi:hypothetical protein
MSPRPPRFSPFTKKLHIARWPIDGHHLHDQEEVYRRQMRWNFRTRTPTAFGYDCEDGWILRLMMAETCFFLLMDMGNGDELIDWCILAGIAFVS